MSTSVDDPKHWYDRGAEMRTLAETMKDAETQRIMRKLASDYDKLGDRAAERARNGVSSHQIRGAPRVDRLTPRDAGLMNSLRPRGHIRRAPLG